MKRVFSEMSEYITPKRLSRFLWVVFLISLIPLIWIGLYNHPSADDFSETFMAHQAWNDTHNIFLMLSAAAKKACGDYFEWMGYFTSNFLMAITPSLYGEVGYIVTTPLLLFLFIFSTKYFLKKILVDAIGMDKYNAGSITCITLFILIQCMVTTGRTELFYWYCSGANYTMTHAMCMWFFGLLISLYYDTSANKVTKGLKVAGIGILGFFVGGGNMLTALNAAIVVVLMLLFFLINHKYKELPNCRLLIIPSVFCIYGLMCSVLAPGNATREAITTGMNPIKAVLVSLYDYFFYCINQWLNWPVVLMIVLLVPVFWRGLRNCKYQFKYPIFVVLLGYGLTSAMMTPSLYAIGNMDAGRLQAMTYIMFILTLVLSEGYVIGYLRAKISNDDSTAQYTKNEVCIIATTIVFFAFAAGLTVIPENHFFTFSSAITDIANGSAKAFSDALYERTDKYLSGEKDIVVYKLPTEPKLLYFSDLAGDYNEWARKAICRYYGFDSLEWIDPEAVE